MTAEPQAASTAPDGTPPYRYTAAMASDIERRWQAHWERAGTFHTPNPSGPLADGPAPDPDEKFYLMDMFPYPSGAGLHVGHPLGFIGTDVLGRFLRMTGRTVLHTMGFDAFGLPAEQYAVQTGTHPRTTTEANVERYRAQIRQLGLAHDQRRSVATTDVEFYRWTQWIFLQIHGSWYDTEADRARPIGELEELFAAGERELPDGRDWVALTRPEQDRVLDGYRLAYLSDAPVNWCPALGTVLSNEEVTAEGRSERGNFPVFRRTLRQWMMRITAYADRLVADLDGVDWPESVKAMQRNWIGRSQGASVRFPVVGSTSEIEVFTTRPDTLFGATYMVLAPEHPLVDAIVPTVWPTPGAGNELDGRWTGGSETPGEAVAAYRRVAASRSELERQEARDKTGVFTGAWVLNPATGEELPVFVADYVLMGYGTGAIMAVPGEDQRDWDFASVFGLPIRRTVQPPEGFDGQAYTGTGPSINSANEELSLNGLGADEARAAIVDWLAARGAGEAVVQYKLRDWLFSRQRYWGEPFPVAYATAESDGGPSIPRALPDSDLPVLLPDVDEYAPRTYAPDDRGSAPESPLARATEWTHVSTELASDPERGFTEYVRETDTMPQWAGSCWYHLRYLDPDNTETFCDPEVERFWLGPRGPGDPGGVDLYVGGVEHAVLHLLYARFWHKVLYDLGHVTSSEPFRRLFNQGYVQAWAYTDARGVYVPAEEVFEDADSPTGFTFNGEPVAQEYGKMGKSLRNVVTPDEMCATYGADTFRLYEMSTGPMEASRPWATRDVVGSHRFLQRVWRLIVDEQDGTLRVTEERADGASEADRETLQILHRTIDGVRADVPALHYNTAVAKLIELANHLTKTYPSGGLPRSVAEPLVLMLAPLCPHVAEELWSRLGRPSTLAYEPFPEADPSLLMADTVEYPIQVNGKVRARVTVPAAAGEDEVRAAALAEEKVAALVGDREPRKVIVVPGRLANVVL